MDRYDAAQDHYCYPGTDVLKNELGIQDAGRLEEAERKITAKTSERIGYRPPPYSLWYLQELHRTLFGPLYSWAGELRDVGIAKGGTVFCIPARLQTEADRLFGDLASEEWLLEMPHDEFCSALARHYCEFNMLHPFREGNGRVQRILFEHLALAAGYELDWSDVTQPEWLQANIDGVNVNYRRMTDVFNRVVKGGR